MRVSLFTIFLPTRSAPLTDPPKKDSADLPLGPDQSSPVAVRAVPEAKRRAGGAPALLYFSRRSIVRSMSRFVIRGLIVHSRPTVRPSRIVVLGAA